MKQERTTHIIRYVHMKICANHGMGMWHWLKPSPGLLSAGTGGASLEAVRKSAVVLEQSAFRTQTCITRCSTSKTQINEMAAHNSPWCLSHLETASLSHRITTKCFWLAPRTLSTAASRAHPHMNQLSLFICLLTR